MPRPKRPAVKVNSVVASAAQIKVKGTTQMPNVPRRSAATGDWQEEAWRFLDTVGELAFYAQYVSNALSKVRLRIMQVAPDGTRTEVTAKDAPSVRALDALFSGDTGQSQMLAACATHLCIPGESWLVGIEPDPDDPTQTSDEWLVLSQAEVKHEGNSWIIERGDGEEYRYSDGTKEDDPRQIALVIRIWRPHPRKNIEATSPVRAALPILRELEGLTKHIAASIDSRLAGAGVLFVPSEMTFQTPQQGGQPGEAAEDDFMGNLTEAMVTPIGDRGSASAVVPTVVKTPGEFIKNIKYQTFSTELSQQALDLRVEAVKRLALSVDMPPEVLLGQADSNHWSAWVISDDAITIHIEPLAELLTEALTTRYLWPSLAGDEAVQDKSTIRQFVIEGDTSDLRQRPNRAADAITLYGLNLLSDAAVIRETGFDPSDAASDDEVKRRLLRHISEGAKSSPELVAAALEALGVTLPVLPPAVAGELTPATPGGAPALPAGGSDPEPAPEAPGAGDEGDRTPPTPSALLAASELLVLRAIERANNKANNRGRVRRPVAKHRLDDALTGAWDQVERTASLCGVSPLALRDTLDAYARQVLVQGIEHDPAVFAEVLRRGVLQREAIRA